MKKINKVSVLFIIMIIVLMGFTSSVKANYQSNNGTRATTNRDTWINGIRKMEGSGQVMGLQEIYNTTTLKATSTSNNIDVHMVKNTEWGAMALLSASQDYGKKGEETARYVVAGSGLKTTTGNAYGIYITGTANLIAASGYSTDLGSVDSRYVNNYYYNSQYIGEAKLNWHEKKGVSGGATSGYGINNWRGARKYFSMGK